MRIIAHLDMDAFFAAVEERDNPRFKGLPLVVGADPKGGRGRGVVSTASYKAREYGIRSAMPISTAWRLSEAARKQGKPAAVFLAVNMRKYEGVSDRVFDIVANVIEKARPPNLPAGKLERASIDEAYLDFSLAGSYRKAEELARRIKEEIKKRERLTASVGIGPNKLIAKIATDRQKPDGLTVVREEEAERFLDPLPTRVIPGVGPKTEEFFGKMGVRLVREAKKFSREELQEMLGKWGSGLYDKLRGGDDSPIETEWIPKSIGKQETFEEDIRDPEFVGARLRKLAEDVFARFTKSGFASFRAVAVTVRFADFETRSRSRTLIAASADFATLEFEAWKLLLPFFDARENPKKKKIRLIGVRVEKLE